MAICLEQGADLHMAQLMPLSLTVSCFSKIQLGFAFLVPAHPWDCTLGILICYHTDGDVFDLRRLQAETKVRTVCS